MYSWLNTPQCRSPRSNFRRSHLPRRLLLEHLEERTLLAGGIFEYPLPSPAARPFGIVTASDNNLWFTEEAANKIARYNAVTNVFTEFPLPAPNRFPDEIVQGSDGNLWFTEANNSRIGRMTTSGMLTGEFPQGGLGGTPEGIAAGPDGKLWFILFISNSVSKIARMTTTGAITAADEFTVPTAGSGVVPSSWRTNAS